MIGNFPQIDELFALMGIITGILGIFFLALAAFTLFKKQIAKCCVQSAFALTFLGLSVIILLLGINFHTYQRLTKEEMIANIQFWQSGPQQFLAVISMDNGINEQSYVLYGDEWQIDARILKWKMPAILAGLDSRYRLERLSGRYRNIDQEKFDQRSVYELTNEPGMKLWPLLTKMRSYLDWVDTYYGNSVYLPMADEAAFQIVLTQSGILTRPENLQARRAVANW